MKRKNESEHAYLKREQRQACDDYFRCCTESGWTNPVEARAASALTLAALTLRLHIFEQGLRLARREARR